MKTLRTALLAVALSATTLFVGYAGVSANTSTETISAHKSPIKPPKAPKGKRVCKANTALTVRSKRKASSAVVGTISAGTVVSVGEREHGWVKVRTGSIRGWTAGSGVTCTRQ